MAGVLTPPYRPAAARGGGRLPRWKSAARNALWTVGILLIVPQGLVPIGFNLFGVDQQVKVWFAARYLPQDRQILAAAGFIAAGLLAIWWAVAIGRGHPTEAQPRVIPPSTDTSR